MNLVATLVLQSRLRSPVPMFSSSPGSLSPFPWFSSVPWLCLFSFYPFALFPIFLLDSGASKSIAFYD
jgi:hypothetical protein